MVSIFYPISYSSCLFFRFLETVPRALTLISIIITFKFHSFFCSLARFRYFSSILFSFTFTLWSADTVKSTRWQILFFLLINTQSGLLTGIFNDSFLSQRPREFYSSHFLGQILLCVCTICVCTICVCTICQHSPILISLILFISFSRTDSALCMYHLCMYHLCMYHLSA